MTFQSDEDEPIDNFDFNGYKIIFDRSNANSAAVKAIAEHGEVLDMIVSQLQVSIVAAMHRDFSELRRSRIRMFMHESLRAESDGSDNGALATNTIGWLGRLMT